jgi:hypothetical protein
MHGVRDMGFVKGACVCRRCFRAALTLDRTGMCP